MKYLPSFPGQEEAILLIKSKEQRLERILQVRTQEKELAATRRKKHQELCIKEWENVCLESMMSWERQKLVQLQKLESELEFLMSQLGMAHKEAKMMTNKQMAHLEELLSLIDGEKALIHQREKVAKDYFKSERDAYIHKMTFIIDRIRAIRLKESAKAHKLAHRHREKQLLEAPANIDIPQSNVKQYRQRNIQRSNYENTMFHNAEYASIRCLPAERPEMNGTVAAVKETRKQELKRQQDVKMKDIHSERAQIRYSDAVKQLNLKKFEAELCKHLDHIKQEDAKRKQKNLALTKTSATAHVDPQHLESIFGKKFLFTNAMEKRFAEPFGRPKKPVVITKKHEYIFTKGGPLEKLH